MYRQMVRIRDLRGSGEPAVPDGQDAGPDPHVFRRGGGRRRHLRGADARRPDHLAPTAATAIAWPRAPSSSRMFCELLGKAEGYCRGKGGSMHIADQANGNLGANAIVGGSAGIATGAALSAKMRGTDERGRLLLRRRRARRRACCTRS